MFKKLFEVESASLNAKVKQEIREHLQLLENDFQKYFPDLKEVSEAFF